MESKLSVEWIALSRLHPNPSNPRLNDAAVEHVAASLRRFGFQQPIVAQRSGAIVAGHTRYKAAKSLGMTEVPVAWFDGSETEAAAYGIADNRTHEYATWDEPALAKLLQGLRAEDSLEGVGFTSEELDDLMARIDLETSGLLDGGEDDVPAPPDAATTRTGDLWILGGHRLLCGDSSRGEDLDRLLGGQTIQLVNMDPPYNVKVEPRSNNAIAAGLSSFTTTHHQGLDVARHPSKATATHEKLRPKDRPLANDFVSDEDFARMLRAWFANASRVLEPGRSFYIWGGYANLGNYPSALAECDLYFSQAIVWNKLHPVLTRKDFMGSFELAFYGWKLGAGHGFFGPANATDLWEIKKVNPQSMIHLTEKPVELAVRAIQYSSRTGENVLDLFGGSGSTLIACEQTGRHAFLMELDALYCDVIVKRWEQRTGKVAKLEGSGQSFADASIERGAA